MKDSFGFIEREDALKEIFFHITEFGPNVATNTVQPGVEVEFDIQDRHVSIRRNQYKNEN
jgi:cold shock CspA family protein